jgi:hypothetical protein
MYLYENYVNLYVQMLLMFIILGSGPHRALNLILQLAGLVSGAELTRPIYKTLQHQNIYIAKKLRY